MLKLPPPRVLTLLIICCISIFCACNAPQTPQDSIDTMIQSHANALEKFSEGLKKPKVIAISDIINYTGEAIDIQSLIAKLKLALSHNHKITFSSAVGGSGANIDTMIKQSRKLRDNAEFNPYTTKEKGELLAPDYSLSGKITKSNGGYEFLLTLSDLGKGVEVWSNIARFHKLPIIDTKIFKNISDELLEKCTKDGDSNACKEMAQMLDTLIATDTKTRKKILGCKKEECLKIGYFYSLISRNTEAIEFVQKAINTGYDEFSKELGAYFILSSIYHYEDNEQKAQYYAKLGCENKEYESCAIVAGEHYEKKEYKEAKKYFESACDKAKNTDMRAFSCKYLGILHYNGLGVVKDTKKGLAYFEDSCYIGSVESCGTLENLYNSGDKDTKQDANLANKFAKKACDLGDKDTCAY